MLRRGGIGSGGRMIAAGKIDLDIITTLRQPDKARFDDAAEAAEQLSG